MGFWQRRGDTATDGTQEGPTAAKDKRPATDDRRLRRLRKKAKRADLPAPADGEAVDAEPPAAPPPDSGATPEPGLSKKDHRRLARLRRKARR